MRLKYTFECIEMDDDIISVPVGENAVDLRAVLKLNEEGHAILELLKNETSEDAIITTLSKEYSTDINVIAGYVHSFIDKLRAADLIIEE